MAPAPGDDAAQQEFRRLDHSLISGIAWTVVFRWIAQAVSWAATLYVVRILTPADYGLVGMATIPIGLARLVEDLGLDAVIVQDRTLSDEQLAKLAGSALCLGSILTVSFIALSTPIALYFRETAVATVVVVLSLTLLNDSIQVVPRALLQRDLKFRTLAWLHGLQVTIAAVLMASCAALSLGYWALVLNTLLSGGAITVVLYGLRPFRVAWPRQFGTIAGSLVAGWRMIVSRAAWYGYSSLDSTFIGRALGKNALGTFGFAMTFASLPLTEVNSMVSKVVPGIFSFVQDSRPKLRRYFLMLTEALSYLTLPISFGLALTADDVVRLALGAKWEAVILPLRILCLYMAVNACQMLVAHVLLWTGHFRANMWLNILALALLPTCFYIGLRWGIVGVAWAWAIGFPLSVVPAVILMSRILDLPLSTYLDALRPALTACLVMSGVVLLAR
ncbi:MAG TPA: lipopolysaccharide biosynthesis protein, partial [Chloroflexota bacterium]|nr:lipopolysaccharide biosynthesis protein [Chloroflexota bacterium]